jgi:DNA-binding response OmpR family regulator
LSEIVERLARVEEQLERLSRRGEDTAELFRCKLEERLPIATSDIMVLLDRLRFRLEVQQPTPLSLTATAPPAAPDEPPSPHVVLSGPGKPPIVLGRDTSRPQTAPSKTTPQPPPEPPLVLDQEHNEQTNFPQIDESQFVMCWHGKRCEFTSGKPFEVLVYLVRKYNTWVSMQHIMDEVWGESRTHENTVQAAISKIRKDLRGFGITDLVIDGKTNPGHYKLHRI